MSRRTVTWLALALAAATAVQCGIAPPTPSSDPAVRAAGARAFATVYEVLQHPRCMNCHPVDRVPLQGDDHRPHSQNVHGGDDGKGRFALRCASCHFEHNGIGPNVPPGAPNWHLPRADMPLVFEGRSPAELARQLADPRHNGGKTMEEIFDHVAHDPLVLWGWAPGDGRRPVDVPHAQFTAAMRTWIDAGCPVPQ